MNEFDALVDIIETHWLKYQPGVTPEGAPGECACGAESPSEYFDWRIWQWHRHHVAGEILVAGWSRTTNAARA